MCDTGAEKKLYRLKDTWYIVCVRLGLERDNKIFFLLRGSGRHVTILLEMLFSAFL